MIVFLLLVIVAILLFGASAVLGVVGRVLGFVALVLALFFGIYQLSKLAGADPGDTLMYGCVGLVVLGVICKIGVVAVEAIERARTDKIQREGRDQEHLSDECASARPSFLLGFHSRAPSKAERKRMRSR